MKLPEITSLHPLTLLSHCVSPPCPPVCGNFKPGLPRAGPRQVSEERASFPRKCGFHSHKAPSSRASDRPKPSIHRDPGSSGSPHVSALPAEGDGVWVGQEFNQEGVVQGISRKSTLRLAPHAGSQYGDCTFLGLLVPDA